MLRRWRLGGASCCSPWWLQQQRQSWRGSRVCTLPVSRRQSSGHWPWQQVRAGIYFCSLYNASQHGMTPTSVASAPRPVNCTVAWHVTSANCATCCCLISFFVQCARPLLTVFCDAAQFCKGTWSNQHPLMQMPLKAGRYQRNCCTTIIKLLFAGDSVLSPAGRLADALPAQRVLIDTLAWVAGLCCPRSLLYDAYATILCCCALLCCYASRFLMTSQSASVITNAGCALASFRSSLSKPLMAPSAS